MSKTSTLLKDYEYLSYIASVGDLIAIAVEIVHSLNSARAPSWAFVIVVFLTALAGMAYGIVTKITSVAIMGTLNTLLSLGLLIIKIYHYYQINHASEEVKQAFYKKCIGHAEKACKASEDVSSAGGTLKENFPSGGQVYR
jgi:hypothetical protein